MADDSRLAARAVDVEPMQVGGLGSCETFDGRKSILVAKSQRFGRSNCIAERDAPSGFELAEQYISQAIAWIRRLRKTLPESLIAAST